MSSYYINMLKSIIILRDFLFKIMKKQLLILTFTGFLFSGVITHNPLNAQKTGVSTGLEIPRFVSLRSNKVNLRTGPGRRYPIDWVLVYQNMPVEIISEFKVWRKVRDWQGSIGWVHQSLLSGRRWVIVHHHQILLRADPRPDAAVVAKISKKSLGRLKTCRGPWCRITFSKYTGWTKRSNIWGIYLNESP